MNEGELREKAVALHRRINGECRERQNGGLCLACEREQEIILGVLADVASTTVSASTYDGALYSLKRAYDSYIRWMPYGSPGAFLDFAKDELLLVGCDHDTPPRHALVRALLAVEWVDTSDGEYASRCGGCARDTRCDMRAHRDGCVVDAALSAAGLDTQEKRDAARARD